MSPDPRPSEPVIDPALLTCRIIAGALVFGVVTFAAVAIVLRLDDPPAAAMTISLMAAAFAAAVTVVRQIVLSLFSGGTGASEGGGTSGALALYQTRMVLGLALLEGAAFFNLVAYLLEGHWWSLAVTAGLVALMLSAFPTRGRLTQWVADREQLGTFGPDGA